MLNIVARLDDYEEKNMFKTWLIVLVFVNYD